MTTNAAGRLVPALVVVFLLATGACAKRQDEFGTAHLAVSANLTNFSSVVVTITGPGIATPLSLSLAQTDGLWQGTATNIPTGLDVFVAAAHFADSATPTLTGTATATVTGGETTAVSIVLSSTSPPFSGYAPAIESVTASNASPQVGQSVALAVVATDQDTTQTLNYLWSESPTGAGSFNQPSTAAPNWTPATMGPAALTITVSDERGNAVAETFTIQVGPAVGAVGITIGVSVSPAITLMSVTPLPLAVGAPAAVSVQATDLFGDQLTYAWTASGCSGTFSTPDAEGNASFTPDTVSDDGNCTLAVTVNGPSGSTTGTLVVSDAAQPAPIFAPTIVGGFASAAVVQNDDTVSLGVSASDPNTETEALSYFWSASVGTFNGPIDHATSSWNAPACLPQDGVTISVQVSNASGLSTTQVFSLPSAAGSACTDPGTCSSGYKLMDSSSTFVLSKNCSGAVRVLVVGGGGAGGAYPGGGGGSGFVYSGQFTISMPVAVTVGGPGQGSSFGGILSAAPGGDGAGGDGNGGSGGSGGGSSYYPNYYGGRGGVNGGAGGVNNNNIANGGTAGQGPFRSRSSPARQSFPAIHRPTTTQVEEEAAGW